MGEGDGGLLCAIFWYNFLCLQLFQNKKVTITIIIVEMGFPGGSAGKESPCNAGLNLGSIPGTGSSPAGGKWQPTPEFLPGESHGLRSQVGYSPKGLRVRHN